MYYNKFILIFVNIFVVINHSVANLNATANSDNLNNSFRLVTRDEWLAQPPGNSLNNLTVNPVDKVVIAHTATESCMSQTHCVIEVRHIQTFHMESRHWDDIAYNFLVGGDGLVYEGRGWTKSGAHTPKYNNISVCIAFIGNFERNTPNSIQIAAAKALLSDGVKTKYLASDYELYAHRTIYSTISPGQQLYNEIKSWPHFIETQTEKNLV